MRLPHAATLLAAIATLPGCLVNTSSRTEYSGRYIGAETFAQIEPGTTNREFVLATLGEPSGKTALSDGSEIWKWEYRKSRSGSGTVFLLLNADNHTESVGGTYVEIKNDIVTKAWRD